MTGLVLGLVATVVGLALGVTGIIVMIRSRSIPRIAVPAQLLGSRWLYSATAYDVVYPDPWGRPLTATVIKSHILPSGFTGQVWVNPHLPTDVCARRWGRHGDTAMTLLVVATPVTMVGLPLLLVALMS